MEKQVEDQTDLDWIRDFLQTLPELERSAFVMRVQYDLPYAEIARVLEMSESAAKVKVHRTRKRLFEIQSRKEAP
jgi:RNA polymerase sigma-70 factor (ECF subfamily)